MDRSGSNGDWVRREQALLSPGAKIPYFPLVVARGKGAVIEDVEGRRYLDFLASAASVNVGHCHPAVVRAIRDQAEKLILYTLAYMYHEPGVLLAEELAAITPGNYPKRLFWGLSGSDANDGAIKMARMATGRSKLISFIRSYHGSTMGAQALTAISPQMGRTGSLVPDVFHVPYPDIYRPPVPGMSPEEVGDYCIRFMEDAFSSYLPPDDVAAVFFEPIQGDSGLIVPPHGFVRTLRALCDRHGILLLSEEVQQGFGRTGTWFGIEQFGVEPDGVIMGKSMASGLPLSAVTARAELLENQAPPTHVFTAGGNPVCCAASLATIRVLREEGLLRQASFLGEYAMARFRDMAARYEVIGDVRGMGLSIGVDLVKSRETKERHHEAAAKVCYRAWEKGLLLAFFSGSVLRVQPPLVISREELDQGLAIIEESLDEFSRGLIPDSVLETVKGW